MPVKQYRKKPVVIEATIWYGDRESLAEIADWLAENDYEPLWIEQPDPDDPRSFIVKVHSLEGWMKIDVGDYVIRGVAGEFYPCKPDIFAKTYEEVSSPVEA